VNGDRQIKKVDESTRLRLYEKLLAAVTDSGEGDQAATNIIASIAEKTIKQDKKTISHP
jgi:hypothetical protein